MNPETPQQPEPVQPATPFDYLALFPGAPTAQMIDSLKKQVPGGRLRLLPMRDGKRIFLLRGFTALELATVQADAAKVAEEKRLYTLQSQLATRCTLWTSVVPSGKLTEQDIALAGAGLVPTLFEAISDLSDYTDPAILDQMYVDF